MHAFRLGADIGEFSTSDKGKRRDWRERGVINSRYHNQNTDYHYNMMHNLAARGMDLVLGSPAIDHLLRRSNKMMSGRECGLLKMWLSQGTII